MTRLLPILFTIFVFQGCYHSSLKKVKLEIKDMDEKAPPDSWMDPKITFWQDPFKNLTTSKEIKPPITNLKKEKIGKRKNIKNTFYRWTLHKYSFNDRHLVWADITNDCENLIEIDFALTQNQWENPKIRTEYYKIINNLIIEIGSKLINDFGNKIVGKEKDHFIEALKALAWQESSWQHYLRYKDWFFVFLGSNFQNKLGDWGITQIARSSFSSKNLLNEHFFNSKGHCSLSSSLYYGFLEFYFCYMDAKNKSCNEDIRQNIVLGAYNRYVSGFSSCYFRFSKSSNKYRDFQIKALDNFTKTISSKPWKKYLRL